MKAQVLHKYDPEMKEKVWVTEQEMPDPKLEKSSDVIVKIGAAGVCRTDLHIVEGVWKHIQDPKEIYYLWLWGMKMQAGLRKLEKM
jgi:NAD+-dependent secondary alcohol dehydrogenase Adh1